jgi:hypothetical protein
VARPGTGDGPAVGHAAAVSGPSRQFAKAPENLDPVAAAAAPLAALTAWQTLADTAHIGPGQRVLIHAGASAVDVVLDLAGSEDYGMRSIGSRTPIGRAKPGTLRGKSSWPSIREPGGPGQCSSVATTLITIPSSTAPNR